MKLQEYQKEKKLISERIEDLLKASSKLDKILWRIMICPPSQRAKMRQLVMLRDHYADILGITYGQKETQKH